MGNAFRQAQNAMRYRMAHSLWFACKMSAMREGRDFSQPEPQLVDFIST